MKTQNDRDFWNLTALAIFGALAVFCYWLLCRYGKFDPAAIGLFDLTVLGLATSRLVHLLTYDKIFEPVRVSVKDKKGPALRKAARGWRRVVDEFLECLWCTGMWSGLLAVTIYYLGAWGKFAVLVLAAAGLGSLLKVISRAVAERS